MKTKLFWLLLLLMPIIVFAKFPLGEIYPIKAQELGIIANEAAESKKYDCVNDYRSLKIPVERHGKWGFVDQQGTEVIPLRYDNVFIFTEGFAIVELDKKYGYIDPTGKEVIPPQYDNCFDFCEGFAVVELAGKYGYIDTAGKQITPIKYDDCRDFSEGLAAVSLGEKWGFINTTGSQITPLKYDWVYNFEAGLAQVFIGDLHEIGEKGAKSGLINTNGLEVVPVKCTYIFDSGKPEWPKRVIIGDKEWYVDKNGKQITPRKYDWCSDFQEGLAAIRQGDKWGFIDFTGKEVIPPQYGDITLYHDGFKEGLALVEKDKKWGFIDLQGEAVIPLQYDHAYLFSEGLAAIEVDKKWGFIDKGGKQIIPPQYDSTRTFERGLAAVKIGEKWGFIDQSGNIVIEPQYDIIYDDFAEGVAWVEIDGATRYINRRGEKLDINDWPRDAKEGLTAFQTGGFWIFGGKWGFFDLNGEIVIPPQYAGIYIDGFSGGLAAVFLDGKWGYIDKSGQMVIAPQFDYATPFSQEEGFTGLAKVRINGKYGVIDQKGNFLVPAQYDAVKLPNDERLGYLESRQLYSAWFLICLYTSVFYIYKKYKRRLLGYENSWQLTA
jgi:hypothetical protein